MSMAATTESRTAKPCPSRIAAVDICSDVRQAEPIWRVLESQFSTPFQRFDFLSSWLRQVGERENLLPLIVIAYDAERRPLLLLPLTVSHRRGIRTASFMGGKHATFNMALWQRDFAATASEADLMALVSGIREHAAADVLALVQQPQSWRGCSNPMMLLPSQPSANDCPLLTMAPGAAPGELIANSFRRRLGSKERKLQKLPGYRYYLASSQSEITRLLDWFVTVKPLRMAEQKLPNVFAEPGVQQFIRDACMKELGDGSHAIDIHAIETDDEVLAMFAGVADGHRFSMMFNTYTMSDNSRQSPGLILTRNIIDHYAGLGYRELDLGIGSDEYKQWFCKSTEPIFDSFIPLSHRGKAAAGAMSSFNRAKHLVKHNQALFLMAQRLRSALRR
ncbi:MAG TPA: GNAT family N-acetyltransferase [Bradyrhizobium sp.]|uniref:GNAT family N-acetyltransferase n=1 Tax=Bradyrhizobium sp. TaxID=376 RepID=UPI002B46C977|nr:GNAT family N-acetyltransferase [Bradyrhizobium sp.]HKO71716.1 GNAT family N-acetyltransferase [Bradyrhizobium sp.]